MEALGEVSLLSRKFLRNFHGSNFPSAEAFTEAFIAVRLLPRKLAFKEAFTAAFVKKIAFTAAFAEVSFLPLNSS